MSPVLHAWRAKLLVARHSLERAARRSSLRVGGMAAFSLAVAGGLFLTFRAAFGFLAGLDVIGPILLVRLLSLFFFALFVMLVLSNVLVSFQTLFRSRELEFWAVQPLPPESVHDARSAEIAVLSSWAFLFLGLPLLLAHGLAAGAPWTYHAAVLPVLVLFAAVAHELGLLLTVLLVRAFPGLDMKRLVLLGAAALVPVGVLVARAFRVQEVGPDDDLSELLVHALEGLGRTQYPLLPGFWAAETLRALAFGETARAAFFAWTLLVTGLFLGSAAREASRRWLVPAQQALRGRGLPRPAFSRTRAASAGSPGSPVVALMRKDVATFLREPAQWSQALLVGVLAVVYVLNLRSLPPLRTGDASGSVAAGLNCGVVLLLVSTLSTRLAFPLVSLEGRRAWIVFCAPLRRRDVVLQKMLLATAAALPFALGLAALSTHVLALPSGVRAATLVACGLGAVALCGLAVGLGALFPDFREDNPARIVSGFGGTAGFLAGVAYVVAMTALAGAPRVLAALDRIAPADLPGISAACAAAAVGLSLLTAIVPLRLGCRRLETMEL